MKAYIKRHRMDRKIVERLRLGEGTNKISRELAVGKRRVIEVRKRAEEQQLLDLGVPLPAFPEVIFPDIVDGRSRRKAPTDEELESYLGWIKERLELGWYPVTVYEELPLTVPRASFYRFLNRHKLREVGRSGRVIPEILSAPGECLQLDWAKLRTVEEDGKKRTVWVFIGVLGFSRYMMARLVCKMDVETTLAAIRCMFEELGGVPLKITTDNPKCIALLADDYEPLLNPVAERFAAHYGCTIECLPPRAPQLKGKVERQVPYVRRLYQAHSSDWWGLEESQHFLNQKLELANRRCHGTTKLRPVELFKQEEQHALRALPLTAYEIERYHSGKVRRDSCVRFDGKYYSVEKKYCGEKVIVIANRAQVTIYHNGKLIETHERLTDLHRSKSIKRHHREPWERTFEEHSIYRERARKLGGWVEELVVTILAQGRGFIDYRKIWGILSLDKRFPAYIINHACMLAHDHTRWSYHAVVDYAESLQALENQESETPRQLTFPHAKFTHDIGQYADHIKLTLIKGGKNEQRNGKSTTEGTGHAHSSEGNRHGTDENEKNGSF